MGDLGEFINLSLGFLLYFWGGIGVNIKFVCLSVVVLIVLVFWFCLVCEMYFLVKNKWKWKDRERKVEFVCCECSLCKGVFCLVKKVCRYKVVFGNKGLVYGLMILNFLVIY